MYQQLPFIEVTADPPSSWGGWEAICAELSLALARHPKPKVVIAVECYHGTLDEVNFQELKQGLQPQASCHTASLFLESDTLFELVAKRMANSPRSGKFTGLSIDDYFDPAKVQAIHESIASIDQGAILIYGIGASKVCAPDLLIYADMSHWEIQQRLRRQDTGNINLNNPHATFERKYEIAFFNDWPICSQLKRGIIGHCDYFLETNNWARPKLATGQIVRQGLKQAVQQPIKMAPFFDPALWEALDVPSRPARKQAAMKHSFSCVPEEDNLLFRFDGILFEVPLLNLIFHQTENFLGSAIVQQFGAYLPIRFNFIDTNDNQDTDFQINVVTQEIIDGLGCRYRQITGYYLLQAKPGATFQLGPPPDLHLPIWQVNELGIKPHDFIQVPNGIPYRAGKKLTAVQINTAPQIFSRLVPHHEVEERLAKVHPGAMRPFQSENGDHQGEETLSREIILLTRHWFTDASAFDTAGNINILLLVAGRAAVVESPEDRFQPFLARYGETIIVPAQIGAYRVRPLRTNPAKPHALLRARIG
jgi:mannose-6-phosphate isomerase